MSELLNNENGAGSGDDELSASGGHTSDDGQHKHDGSKVFCTKKLREIWTDPKAMAVSLANFLKLFGVNVKLSLCLADISENSNYQVRNYEYNKMKKYIHDLQGELLKLDVGIAGSKVLAEEMEGKLKKGET